MVGEDVVIPALKVNVVTPIASVTVKFFSKYVLPLPTTAKELPGINP